VTPGAGDPSTLPYRRHPIRAFGVDREFFESACSGGLMKAIRMWCIRAPDREGWRGLETTAWAPSRPRGPAEKIRQDQGALDRPQTASRIREPPLRRRGISSLTREPSGGGRAISPRDRSSAARGAAPRPGRWDRPHIAVRALVILILWTLTVIVTRKVHRLPDAGPTTRARRACGVSPLARREPDRSRRPRLLGVGVSLFTVTA